MRPTKPEDAGSEVGFFSRWSQRKQQEGSERPASPLERPPSVGKDAAEALPTDADMPSIDSLTEESDFTGFLSPRVSEELRRMALRKLFRSATFNIRDGLDDYDDDYTSFAKLGDLVTAEMRHRLEMEAQRTRGLSAEAGLGDAPGKVVPEQTSAAGDDGDAASDDGTRQVAAAADPSNTDVDSKEGPET